MKSIKKGRDRRNGDDYIKGSIKRNTAKKDKNRKSGVIKGIITSLCLIVTVIVIVKFNIGDIDHSMHAIKDASLDYIYVPEDNKLQKKEVLVCIDAGHGGKDPGAMTKDRIEKEETLILAKQVKKYLEMNNIKVMMTREDDTFLTPKQRAKMANKANADMLISIHRNSLPSSKKTNGIDIYINFQQTEEDCALGNDLKYYLERAGRMNVNSISPGSATDSKENYTVVGKTKMPAALVEMGYMTNKKDNIYFDESINSYALAISKGIMKYLEEH
ncbi:MAG: N-acetylmuramoyl-L-alanine amidase [Lachnospiraceae bacterium]|nr:N-acetylmuramoyl-L-alanine amidase [Lachnospiraceae bacterium]